LIAWSPWLDSHAHSFDAIMMCDGRPHQLSERGGICVKALYFLMYFLFLTFVLNITNCRTSASLMIAQRNELDMDNTWQ
jgi:hypothetical protein